MHNTKPMARKDTTIERTVEALRKRFDSLLGKCGGPHRLAKRLSQFDSYFNESIGVYEVSNAKRGKAGEVAMTRIVATMELLAAASPITAQTRAAKSLERMGVVAAYEPKYPATKQLKEKFSHSK